MSKLLIVKILFSFALLGGLASLFLFAKHAQIVESTQNYQHKRQAGGIISKSRGGSIVSCKDMRALLTSINFENDPTEDPEAIQTLHAHFRALRSATLNSDKIRYYWKLPDGVTRVDGAIEGSIDIRQSDSLEWEASLRVRGIHTTKFQQIELIAHLEQNGAKLQMSNAVVSSRRENTLEFYGQKMSEVRSGQLQSEN